MSPVVGPGAESSLFFCIRGYRSLRACFCSLFLADKYGGLPTEFHLSGFRVISNDADRFKRFYFFCPRTHLSHCTRIASLWLPCSLVSPQPARAVSASSIRCCPPNISSVTIDHDELRS